MFRFNGSIVLAAFVSAGCAAAPGTRPHDMSAAQHEAAAQEEQTLADSHGAQYDPAAAGGEKACGGRVCWSSRANPSAVHADDAAKHRELAAKHRALAEALKQAEAQACVGIEEEDRDTSPFYHREDVVSVTYVQSPVRGAKGTPTRKTGARVIFRAVPGLTAEWLQREIDCHLARASAVGHEMPEMGYCPLVLKGVKAKVSSVGNGFAVELTSDDAQTVEQIMQRAQALQGVQASAVSAAAK